MTLPAITAPAGTPVFQAAGHEVQEDSVYAQVAFGTGHSRARRVFTVTERVVSVRWFLEADQLVAVESWYENDLVAGSREFSAHVKNVGAGLLWWNARWVRFQTEMLTRNRGVVSGALLLTGEGSVTPPVTGALAMQVLVELLDVRSSIHLAKPLVMEIDVTLLQPRQLAMEIAAELLSLYPPVSSGDVGRIWARLALTPGRSDLIDLTDQTLIQRAWMEI